MLENIIDSKKYFYIEDYSNILIKANGSALTISLVAVTNILTKEISFNITPSLFYFLGLILAFGVHATIKIQNDDLRNREKRDSSLQTLAEFHKIKNLPPELQTKIELLNETIHKNENNLLKLSQIKNIQNKGNIMYLLSLISFTIGTSVALYYLWQINK